MMPTYVYETIPADPSEEPICFEITQRMTDDALKTHPETGQAIRRVITGGISILSNKGEPSSGESCCSNSSCCG